MTDVGGVDPQARFQEGLRLRKGREHIAALAVFDEFITGRHGEAGGYPELGFRYAFKSLTSLEQWLRLEDLAREATRRFPDLWHAHHHLAVALIMQGHELDARLPLDRAIELAPDEAEPRNLEQLLAPRLLRRLRRRPSAPEDSDGAIPHPEGGPERFSRHLTNVAWWAEHDAQLKASRFRWDPVAGMAASALSFQAADPRPLTVLMTKGGKSLFGSLEDDRVRILRPGEPLTAAPDLVVTADEHDLLGDPRQLELPDEVWRRLHAGSTKLVIDSCSEGHRHSPGRFSALHSFFRAVGIAPSACVYITQDRAFRADYLAHHRSLGLTEPGMEVLVHDRYIQFLCAALRAVDDRDRFRRELHTYASAGAVRDRRFLSLNYKLVHPHRALFLLRLLRDGLWSSGHISVGPLYEFDGRTITKGQFLKRVYSEPELRGPLNEVLGQFDRLEALSPTHIGLADTAGGTAKGLYVPVMYDEYVSSWFSLVIETDATSHLHRITEKPFKPLLCFHPLIVLGSCGSLQLIRDYGFETFPDLFDESYDQETDLRTRFEMVYEQVARLCRMSESELARRCEAVSEAVVFNACWGLTQLPGLFRDRVDAALIDRLIGFAHAGRAPQQSA